VDGTDYLFSFREWGAYMAEWMNGSSFPGTAWDYLNFYDYHYVAEVISDYEDYWDGLLGVIQTKCQRGAGGNRVR